jgi:hypothetical protein
VYRLIEKGLSGNEGFRVDHRITMGVDPSLAGYTTEQTQQFYRALLEQTRGLPGVKSAALSVSLPMTSNFGVRFVIPEGFQFPAGQESERVFTDIVSDQYFDTFAIPIPAGRSFLPSDRAESPLVAVVNQEFARRFFNGNAVGKRLHTDPNGPWIEIVGTTVTLPSRPQNA